MKKLLFIFFAVLIGVVCKGQTISHFAGSYGTSGYSGDGAAATAALFSNPSSMAMDDYGNVYVADAGNNVVRKIDQSGVITTFAGNGTTGYSGDGGMATDAQLNSPSGIAVYDGILYICDMNNNVIRCVSLDYGSIFTLVGDGTPGYSGDSSFYAGALLDRPTKITLDRLGNIYFIDQNGIFIRKIEMHDGSGIISTFYSMWWFYCHPFADIVADTACNIFLVASCGGTVVKVSPLGIADTIAGPSIGYSGDGGAASLAAVNNITGTAIDFNNDIYIADNGNYRVRKINSYGVISTVIGTGAASNSGDGGLSSSAAITNITGILYDGCGNLYVAAANGIRKAHVDTISARFPISLPDSICLGHEMSVPHPFYYGYWTSSDSSVAHILEMGTTFGISGTETFLSLTNSGSAIISFATCGTTYSHSLTVGRLPNVGHITGLNSLCYPSDLTLVDTVSSGTWSSTNPSVAYVSSTGIVSPLIAGSTIISFSTTNWCGMNADTQIVNVDTLLAVSPILGANAMCISTTLSFSDTTSGGVWSSSLRLPWFPQPALLLG